MGVDSMGKSGRACPQGAMTLAVVYLALALSAASCSKSEAPLGESGEPSARRVIAVINDEPLYLEQFNNKFELSQASYFAGRAGSPEKIKELKRIFLNQLIETVILAQEAKRRNITASETEVVNLVNAIEAEHGPDELEKLLKARGIDMVLWRQGVAENLAVQKLLEEEVSKKANVNEDEIAREYEANVKEFVRPRMVRALQILVATEKEAKEARWKLLKGADFSKLASQISIGPEAEKGGDFGFFEQGVMPEEFDEVIFSLRKGRISKIVKSPYGYHIFKVVDEKKGGKLKFDEVREKIRSRLIQRKQKVNYQRFVDQLKANSKVEVKYELID